jgi:hypothetical protein
MPERETLDYLETELGKQISGFDSSRRFYRNANFYLTLATATLSASTTVLIGAGQILHLEWVSIIALICSAAITVAAAYDGFLRSHELWIQKTDTWVALQNLDAHIKYTKAKASGHLSQQEIDDFYTRFDQLLMSEHELWKTLRATRDQVAPSQSGPRRDVPIKSGTEAG